MTVEQALSIIDQVAAVAKLDRREQQICMQALEIIKNEILKKGETK